MTKVHRTIEGISTVGAITIGFMVTPICVSIRVIVSNALHLDPGSWTTPLLGSTLCSLLTCGALAIGDRLISY